MWPHFRRGLVFALAPLNLWNSLSNRNVFVFMFSLPTDLRVFPNEVTHGGSHDPHLMVHVNKEISHWGLTILERPNPCF